MTVARWVSIILHPFVMVGVLAGTAAATRQTRGEAFRSVGIVAVFTILPLAVLMWRQVRRGLWQNADASHRAERPILYVVGAIGLIALLAYLVWWRPDSLMARGVVATLGMLGVCGMATRWIKVSLHMAFATLAATGLALMRAPVGYALLVALPALMWSRLTLHRHTRGEVAVGTIVGAATGLAIHYL